MLWPSIGTRGSSPKSDRRSARTCQMPHQRWRAVVACAEKIEYKNPAPDGDCQSGVKCTRMAGLVTSSFTLSSPLALLVPPGRSDPHLACSTAVLQKQNKSAPRMICTLECDVMFHEKSQACSDLTLALAGELGLLVFCGCFCFVAPSKENPRRNDSL